MVHNTCWWIRLIFKSPNCYQPFSIGLWQTQLCDLSMHPSIAICALEEMLSKTAQIKLPHLYALWRKMQYQHLTKSSLNFKNYTRRIYYWYILIGTFFKKPDRRLKTYILEKYHNWKMWCIFKQLNEWDAGRLYVLSGFQKFTFTFFMTLDWIFNSISIFVKSKIFLKIWPSIFQKYKVFPNIRTIYYLHISICFNTTCLFISDVKKNSVQFGS